MSRLDSTPDTVSISGLKCTATVNISQLQPGAADPPVRAEPGPHEQAGQCPGHGLHQRAQVHSHGKFKSVFYGSGSSGSVINGFLDPGPHEQAGQYPGHCLHQRAQVHSHGKLPASYNQFCGFLDPVDPQLMASWILIRSSKFGC